MRSDPSNWLVNSWCCQYRLLIGLPNAWLLVVAPIGTLLMISTPQATAASTTPEAMRE
jgi:hypothetical protein